MGPWAPWQRNAALGIGDACWPCGGPITLGRAGALWIIFHAPLPLCYLQDIGFVPRCTCSISLKRPAFNITHPTSLHMCLRLFLSSGSVGRADSTAMPAAVAMHISDMPYARVRICGRGQVGGARAVTLRPAPKCLTRTGVWVGQGQGVHGVTGRPVHFRFRSRLPRSSGLWVPGSDSRVYVCIVGVLSSHDTVCCHRPLHSSVSTCRHAFGSGVYHTQTYAISLCGKALCGFIVLGEVGPDSDGRSDTLDIWEPGLSCRNVPGPSSIPGEPSMLTATWPAVRFFLCMMCFGLYLVQHHDPDTSTCVTPTSRQRHQYHSPLITTVTMY